MRPNVSTITTQGDLGGQKVAMSFDANSLAHIMSVLTDLYSDPELAIIREYSTNAYDSHIAAGVDRPIEVSLPNHLSTYFKVKDYGLGLSADDIVEIYSKYGASTKRDTNTQTGMLGLGCKSALTYSHQFNLVGIKDGIKTSVSISRSADGSGTMEIVASTPTTEPNGVEVIIPAKNTRSLTEKSREFFKFWPKDAVLIDGVSPASFEKIQLNNYIDLVMGSTGDVIVMGNVAYPLEEKIKIADTNGYYAGSYWRNFSFVVYVDIGEVDFTPSREKLHFTKRTQDKIKEIANDINRDLPGVLQKEIDRAESHKEALEIYENWSRILNLKLEKIVFQGDELELKLEVDHFYNLADTKFTENYGHGVWASSVRVKHTAVIINYDEEKHTSHKRRKMRKWLENLGKTDSIYYIYFKKDGFPPKWFDGILVGDWEEIKKIKFPKSPPKSGTELVYNKVTRFGSVEKVTELDSHLPTVYFFANQFPSSNKREYIARYFWGTHNVVSVSSVGNAHSNFLKANPNAKTIRAAIDEDYNNFVSGLTTSQIRIIFENNGHAFYSHADPNKVDDPEIKQAIKERVTSQDIRAAINKFEKIRLAYSSIFGEYRSRPESDSNDPLEKYPLVAEVSSYHCFNLMDEIYFYLNTAYKERQNKS